MGVWDKMIQTDPEHGGGAAADQIFLLAYGGWWIGHGVKFR